jgi:hypothetical protein
MVAWTYLSAGARQVFRDALEVDDPTWARGRGWVLHLGLMAAALLGGQPGAWQHRPVHDRGKFWLTPGKVTKTMAIYLPWLAAPGLLTSRCLRERHLGTVILKGLRTRRLRYLTPWMSLQRGERREQWPRSA